MNLSARSQLAGVVTSIVHNVVNEGIGLTLNGGQKPVSGVTKTGREAIELETGKEAIALIKAPWIVLASPDCRLKFCARNPYSGVISEIVKGAINDAVTINVDDKSKLAAVETDTGVDKMKFNVGDSMIALIKTSSVLPAVTADAIDR